MKKIFRYPFLCLLVLSSALAAPFIWQQIGLLPDNVLPFQQEDPRMEAPAEPVPPVTTQPPEIPDQPASETVATPPVVSRPLPYKPPLRPSPGDLPPPEPKPVKPEEPFVNALFVGDSRTVGIGKYAGIKEADFFASTGMSVYQLFDKKVDMTDKKGVLLEELLAEKTYDRIYVMLGINELGFNFDRTVTTYGEAVARLQQLQPEAYIHIQANLHVTKAKSDGDKLYNNANIDRLNEALSALADEKMVFFMDVNPAFDDGEGNLQGDLTWDGVHLLSKHYSLWADWLKENTPA